MKEKRNLTQRENNIGLPGRENKTWGGGGARAVCVCVCAWARAKAEKGESTWICWGYICFNKSVIIPQTYLKFF